MGNEVSCNGVSYNTDAVHLLPLDQPVVAIHPRFSHDELLTLQRKASPLGSKVSLRDVQTDAVRFAVNQSRRSSRLTLLDCGNVVAATCCPQKVDPNRLDSDIYDDGNAAIVIHAHFRIGFNTTVHATFTDRITHEQYELGFEGHWRKRTAHFWLASSSDKSVRKPVAKVFCPDGVSRLKYYVAVAPRMDAGLIAMVCGILDEQEDFGEMTKSARYEVSIAS